MFYKTHHGYKKKPTKIRVNYLNVRKQKRPSSEIDLMIKYKLQKRDMDIRYIHTPCQFKFLTDDVSNLMNHTHFYQKIKVRACVWEFVL